MPGAVCPETATDGAQIQSLERTWRTASSETWATPRTASSPSMQLGLRTYVLASRRQRPARHADSLTPCVALTPCQQCSVTRCLGGCTSFTRGWGQRPLLQPVEGERVQGHSWQGDNLRRPGNFLPGTKQDPAGTGDACGRVQRGQRAGAEMCAAVRIRFRRRERCCCETDSGAATRSN